MPKNRHISLEDNAKDMFSRRVDQLVDRNTEDVWAQFLEDPEAILVSVQIEEEQEEHLRSGLTMRSRRLIPITLLAKMLKDLSG